MADRARPYKATIGGLDVRCESPEDAAAIAKAANILGRIDQANYPKQEIDRLVKILTRYSRSRAARLLRFRSMFE